MRRRTWLMLLAIVTVGVGGCSWEFWGLPFYSNYGEVESSDYSSNRSYDFKQRHDEQMRMAEEYYRK